MILSLASLAVLYVGALMVLVFLRQEMQPLKIKSPRLLLICIFANLFIIISVSVVQLSEEKCVNEDGSQDPDGICKWSILEVFAMIFGYVVVGFTEPFSFVAYVLRAFRQRRIFDAQLTYFKEDRKPVELIEKFRENRLIMIAALSVGCVTILYLTSALLLVYTPEGDKSMLYVLPTIDTASFVNRIKYVSQEEA